jgi:hypothetical protein
MTAIGHLAPKNDAARENTRHCGVDDRTRTAQNKTTSEVRMAKS